MIKRVVNNINDRYETWGVLDDYVYLNGESQPKINWKLPYIIVCGDRGVGKSSYSRIMSSYECNKGIQFISFQSLTQIAPTFVMHVLKIIEIKEWNKEDLYK